METISSISLSKLWAALGTSFEEEEAIKTKDAKVNQEKEKVTSSWRGKNL